MKTLAERVSRLEVEVFKKDRPDYPSYLTVSEFAKRQGLSLSRGEIISISKQAVDLCNEKDLPVDYVLHGPSYPVNTYPVKILKELIWNTE
jgi:hypothetical protein